MGSAEHQHRGMSGTECRKVLGPPPYRAPQGVWGAHQLQTSRSTNLVDRDVADVPLSSPGKGLKGWIRQIKAPQTSSGTVAKLTARGEQAPKLKYLNKVADLMAGADAAEVLAGLNKRPVMSDPLVALKACVLVHHVMHSGAGDALSAACKQLPLLEELRATYSKPPLNPGVSFSSLIVGYSSLLESKAKFHHRFLSFEADYSVDFKSYRSRSSGHETRNPLSLAAVEALSSLLSLSLSCASLCLHHLKGAGSAEGLLVAVTIPILREADLVHACTWRLLDLLAQGATLLSLPAQGLKSAQAQGVLHHSSLRVLYEGVRKDPALAMQVQPPVLPEEPPCLAPPPFISTESTTKDWYWPGELSIEEQEGLQREVDPTTIGGVGAAMEAAMQRHAAGQAEARRIQPPSSAAPTPPTPPTPPAPLPPHPLHAQQPPPPVEGQSYLDRMLRQIHKEEEQQRMMQTAQFADLVAHSPYRPQQAHAGPPLNHPAAAPPVPPTPPQPTPAPQPRENSPPVGSEWEIPYQELRLGPVVGRGAFGDVVHGSWQGTEVAVKCLQNVDPNTYERAAQDFRREMALVCRLRHPNVVLFMGACTKEKELCIVMEYAARGALYGVLRDARLALDWTTILRWALEAARGINYLHTRTPPICHRHIKVSDFGLARTKANSSTQTQVGTWAWMAPEVLEQRPYDEKADVYSYGVVLWELFTREEPFKDLHPMQIMRAIDRGERPFLPPACPPVYRNLVYDCWQTNPRLRPSFQTIIERLVPLQQLQQPYTLA